MPKKSKNEATIDEAGRLMAAGNAADALPIYESILKKEPKNAAALFETTANRFGIGAWIVGTTTMKEFADRNFKLKPAKQSIERDDYVANPNAVRFAIGVDGRL